MSTATAPPQPPELPGELSGLDAHAHARAVLQAALLAGGEPSHAYLFHGPSGTGKRTIARGFAAMLLADGAEDPTTASARVLRGTHPDLTWVTPSGAGEMLVGDIDEDVVGAMAHTPFESRRRVFVIESAETMSDQVANRLLKTLEEPPSFAHLILLARRVHDVLPTIASRCQLARFDPLAPAELERELVGEGQPQTPRIRACARLAQGDATLAARLAGEGGEELRASGERLARGALRGESAARPWQGLLDQAREAGAQATAAIGEAAEHEAELLPAKERRRHLREAGEAARRGERRERTATLASALGLAELWLRDVWLLTEGASELVYAVDRLPELSEDASGRTPRALRRAVDLVAQTRLRLAANVAEELALEALTYRLELALEHSGGGASS